MHRTASALRPLRLEADGSHVLAYLSTDPDAVEPDDAQAVARVRVSSDRGPGYYAASAELVDVEGDPEGVAAWVDAHEHELLSAHGEVAL
jgi:hypothetical protein